MYYITQSTIITSLIGFNIGLTNVDTRLNNVVSTLLQRRALMLYQRCATLKIRRRILFHFQHRINVISTLIHNVDVINYPWHTEYPNLILQFQEGGGCGGGNIFSYNVIFSLMPSLGSGWTSTSTSISVCKYYIG